MPDDDLVRRLAAVEAELSLLRNDLREQNIAQRVSDADSRAARTLAAGADRDVSELREEMRGHTRALNALRMTQIELYSKHEADLAAQRDETRQGFARLGEGMAQIVALLGDTDG